YDTEGASGTGNVLRSRVINACIDKGLKVYDFLGELAEHKRHWRATERPGEDLFMARGSLKNRMLFRRNIWPTGRYIHQGRPANQGHSQD
ncbi:MAG: GNAT family N-acetyltransferase, partial [Planctomycetota bacterium]